MKKRFFPSNSPFQKTLVRGEYLSISIIKSTNGSEYNTSRAGAGPHGQKDKVMPPKKLISALPTSNWEPTLSGADWERRLAAQKDNKFYAIVY